MYPNSALNAGDRYALWQRDIERIKDEITELFTDRYKFRRIVEMFERNERLNRVGGDLYEWMLRMWGADAILAVLRQVDDSPGVIGMHALLLDMEQHAEILTRARYLAFLRSGDDDFLRETMNTGFDKLGAQFPHDSQVSPERDHISADSIRRDRLELVEKTRLVKTYADTRLLHRYPGDAIEIKVKDVHDAIDALEPVLQRYFVLLTGSWLVQAEAAIQYNWMAPFEFPWSDGRRGR
jgi:hypothetical protein